MIKIFNSIILSLVFLLVISCSESPVGNKIENIPPDTWISVFPDSGITISKQQSILRVHWWGDDPDGFVQSYKFTWNGIKWDTTKSNDSLFTLQISGLDTNYLFQVASIDNFGTSDPTPAKFKFPIMNSPPKISFPVGYAVPDTTFTVASFMWDITDLEGTETVDKVYVSLNDSTDFTELPGSTRFVTISARPPFSSGTVDANLILGLTNPVNSSVKLKNLKLNSKNYFYVKAKDIAGAYSKTIVLPDSGKSWYVQKPKGDLLILRDNLTQDASAGAYSNILDSIVSNSYSFKGKYDIWDIKYGKTTTTLGVNLPKTIKPTVTEILKLYKYVFWYTADYDPSINVLELCLNDYLKSGGKVLLTFNPADKSTFDVNVLKNFLPLDSVNTNVGVSSVIPRNTSLNLTATGSSLGYPLLSTDNNTAPVARILGYYPNELTAKPLYTLGLSGSPVIGFKTSDTRLVFVGLPLFRCNGGLGNLKEFFKKVLFDEFGATP